MVKVTCDRAIKAVILLILLVVFFFLFFWQVVVQYSEAVTNTSKTALKAEKIVMPTLTICSGWKRSILKEYKITPAIFSIPSVSNTNLPSNATLRTIFDDVVFKLNKDFVIGLSLKYQEPILLKVGMNKIKTENSIDNYEVKKIPTNLNGMCYAIIPIGITMQPYEETMLIYIAKNNTSSNEEMTKVSIQISSNDTYNTIVNKVSGMKNRIIEKNFISNAENLVFYYTEENTEFIKDCSDSSFFKRFAEKMKETEKFNCTKKYVPLTFDSAMDVINHSIPKCMDPIEKDEYCMIGFKGFGIIQKLKSTCIKQCNIKGSSLDIMEVEQDPIHPLGKAMNV